MERFVERFAFKEILVLAWSKRQILFQSAIKELKLYQFDVFGRESPLQTYADLSGEPFQNGRKTGLYGNT